jgi:hypothetical protein
LSEDLLVHLFTVDCDSARGFYSKAYLIAVYFKDDNLDVVPDNDGLAAAAGKDQHVTLPTVE